MASQRLTVALLTACVASVVGGTLLATGVLSIENDAAPSDAGRENVARATATDRPVDGEVESALDAIVINDRPLDPPPRPLEVVPPAERERVRRLSWDEARESLTSSEAWASAPESRREKVARRVGARLPGVSYQRFETFAAAGRQHRLAVFQHDRTGLELVLIPGGTFAMGSPDGEVGRDAHETSHEVTLAPFLISRTEVTQSAWLRVYRYAELMPSSWRGPDLPIETISHAAAAKFCERAGGRLPTEAEWEFACRAGSEERYWFGDDEAELPAHAWVRSNSGQRTRPVGMRPANPFGLHDMHGNVWEWVADRYGPYPSEPVTNPLGPTSGFPIIRGGSWHDVPKDARSAKRLAWSIAQHNVGFRMAKSVGD